MFKFSKSIRSIGLILGILSINILILSLYLLSASIVSAAGAVYYVEKSSVGGDGLSWGQAFTDVQSALDVAVSGDQIWVATGLYTPTKQMDIADARTATFSLTEGVLLYGGFISGDVALADRDFEANKTVLSGDIDGNDTTDADGVLLNVSGIQGNNAYHVIHSWQISDVVSTRVDGFYITGGDADGANIAGLECGYNCGGGIYNYTSHADFSNLVVQGNYGRLGGGIYNNGSRSLYFNILAQGNDAQGRGGAFKNTRSPITIMNSTMVGNTSNDGSAVSNFRSNPTIINSTIAFNDGGSGSGGIHGQNISEPSVTNTIFWGNISSVAGIADIELVESSVITVTYSLISGSMPYTGTGNITSTVSPFIQDASPGGDGIWGTADDDFGDLTLRSDAAALDVGDDTAIPADSLDLDYDGNTAEYVPIDLAGNDRLANGTVDLGAYEFSGSTLFTPTVTLVANDAMTSTLTWDDLTGCTYDLYESTAAYAGFASTGSGISSPYETAFSGPVSFYYVEADCGGETAVSQTVGRFEFEVKPGS